jgi:drug/metabolite transporter (DMT)-like permease
VAQEHDGIGHGRLAALGSAISFGIVAPLAGLAYDGGASPGVVVMARLLFGLAAAAGAVGLLRRGWALPRRDWPGTLAVALAWTLVTVAYMASFYFMPVSLAVLIFFTFPVLIALVEPLVARRRPAPASIATALLAFGGLALALGPDMGGLDRRGFALALLAALGATTTFILSQRLVADRDMFAFSFHLHLVCVPVAALTLPLIGGLAWPAGGFAWLGLTGVGLFYVSAVLLQFAAIRRAGPARASIVFNAEPVITIVGAGLVLGEVLRPMQWTGAALVIVAVLLSARIDRPVPAG